MAKIGRLCLRCFVKLELPKKKTNHSNRAVGLSQLFEAGVDEKIFQSRSGHRSNEALSKKQFQLFLLLEKRKNTEENYRHFLSIFHQVLVYKL